MTRPFAILVSGHVHGGRGVFHSEYGPSHAAQAARPHLNPRTFHLWCWNPWQPRPLESSKNPSVWVENVKKALRDGQMEGLTPNMLSIEASLLWSRRRNCSLAVPGDDGRGPRRFAGRLLGVSSFSGTLSTGSHTVRKNTRTRP